MVHYWLRLKWAFNANRCVADNWQGESTAEKRGKGSRGYRWVRERMAVGTGMGRDTAPLLHRWGRSMVGAGGSVDEQGQRSSALQSAHHPLGHRPGGAKLATGQSRLGSFNTAAPLDPSLRESEAENTTEPSTAGRQKYQTWGGTGFVPTGRVPTGMGTP